MTQGYILLEGSPRNRGLTHGATLKREIAELIDLWKDTLRTKFQTEPDELISKFLKKTNYITAIQKFTPEVFEEVKGIAEGACIDVDTVFAFQLMDEMLLSLGDISNEHCTTIGVNAIGGNPTYLAQTWDIGGYLDGFQTVLHIKHEGTGLESYVFTYAGFIAAFGMNNKKVGISVNSIAQLNCEREGLPVAFVIRGLLERTSQSDAVAFLHEIKHASPQNYLIAGAETVLDFECSPNKITSFANPGRKDVVFHTNHSILNDDFSGKYIEHKNKQGDAAISADNSHTRYKDLISRMNKPAEAFSVDALKDILSSCDSVEHPVRMDYVDASTIFNLGSTVMVMSGNPEFHIAFGAANVAPFKVYRFE